MFPLIVENRIRKERNKSNIYIIMGFGRVTRPCAARTLLLKLTNIQNGALRPLPTVAALLRLYHPPKNYFLSGIRTWATWVMGSPEVFFIYSPGWNLGYLPPSSKYWVRAQGQEWLTYCLG
jgi:hypothetical protein